MTGIQRFRVIATFALLGCTVQASSVLDAAVGGRTTEAVALGRRIRQSHERQRDLFQTLRVETVYVKPDASLEGEHALPMSLNFLQVAAGTVLRRGIFD